MSRTNFSPTARTIIVVLVLMLVGLLGTSGGLLTPPWGIAAYVVAEVLLLIGVATRQL